MIDVVNDWNGRDVKLRPGTFWHLTPKGGLFLNNARVGKGIVYSVAAIAREPGLSKAVSPYSLVQEGDPKEAIWEDVRTQSYRHLPSRLKAFYCFEDRELADRAAREWFRGEARAPIELRISEEASVHRCDAKLLDALPDQWRANADRYWKGEMTVAPFPETIVDGAVYAPGWEQFPIGFR
jgi:hypothetical protein